MLGERSPCLVPEHIVKPWLTGHHKEIIFSMVHGLLYSQILMPAIKQSFVRNGDHQGSCLSVSHKPVEPDDLYTSFFKVGVIIGVNRTPGINLDTEQIPKN